MTSGQGKLRIIVTWLLVVERFLFGLIFTVSGAGWFVWPDRPGYLGDAIRDGIERGLTLPVYAPFLEGLVLPHPVLFVWLVGLGELASGLSLALGFPKRAGALGAVFLTANYSLAFGGGNVLLLALLLPLVTALPYRRLIPLDRWRSGRPGGE